MRAPSVGGLSGGLLRRARLANVGRPSRARVADRVSKRVPLKRVGLCNDCIFPRAHHPHGSLSAMGGISISHTCWPTVGPACARHPLSSRYARTCIFICTRVSICRFLSRVSIMYVHVCHFLQGVLHRPVCPSPSRGLFRDLGCQLHWCTLHLRQCNVYRLLNKEAAVWRAPTNIPKETSDHDR